MKDGVRNVTDFENKEILENVLKLAENYSVASIIGIDGSKLSNKEAYNYSEGLKEAKATRKVIRKMCIKYPDLVDARKYKLGMEKIDRYITLVRKIVRDHHYYSPDSKKSVVVGDVDKAQHNNETYRASDRMHDILHVAHERINRLNKINK